MLDELIACIKGDDEKLRGQAWLNAEVAGAEGVKPLAALLTGQDVEIVRAARRALWKIVRDVGRPGADQARKAVVAELLGLCKADQPAAVRREVVWMLSEIGQDESVEAVAGMLSVAELREDARCVLQRIPGERSLAALKAALADAPEDFKLNIAQSLRQRGVEVPGLPCRKLVPTRKTAVKPAAGA